jgi:hypothetical protein
MRRLFEEWLYGGREDVAGLQPLTFDICEFSKIDFSRAPYISPNKKQ